MTEIEKGADERLTTSVPAEVAERVRRFAAERHRGNTSRALASLIVLGLMELEGDSCDV